MPGSGKFCVVCGEDCSGRPRVKDPKGRYYCRTCHDEGLRKQQANERAMESAAQALDRDLAIDDDNAGMMEDILGSLEESRGDSTPPEAIMSDTGRSPAPPSSDPRIHHRQLSATARDTIRAEYVKPAVLIIVGVTATLVAVMGMGATLGAAEGSGAAAGSAVGGVLAVALLVQLAFGSVITAGVYWFAAKTWLGDIGPPQLILLRVAGINATALGVLILSLTLGMAAGGIALPCFGILGTFVCIIMLTMWLFDLSFLQVVLLTVFSVAVMIGLGFVFQALGFGT